MAKLILRSRSHSAEFEIRGLITIGRQSSNDIVLLDEQSSRNHARVVRSGSGFVLEDMDSANGTLVNGQRVSPSVKLLNGDLIRIGDAELTFLSGDASSGGRIGQTIGNYEILEELSRWPGGTVYMASQVTMARQVVLKVMELARRSRAEIDAFLEDARVAARLNHTNLVRVHDFGETSEICYVSMELVQGETFEKVLTGPAMPLKRALQVAREIALAAGHAHETGICLGELDPTHVVLTRDGHAKVTGVSLRSGNTLYRAPEVERGVSLSPATDVYAIGMIAKKLIARDSGSTPPENVQRLVELCLSKNPIIRPSPGNVLAERLADLIDKLPDGPAKRAPRPTPVRLPAVDSTRQTRRGRRAGNKARDAMIAIGAVSAAIFVALGLLSMSTGESRVPVPRHADSADSPPDNHSPGQVVAAAGSTEMPQVDRERLAAESLVAIKEMLVAHPDRKTFVLRSLHRMSSDFPGTRAGTEARRLYSLWSGGVDPDPKEIADISPTGEIVKPEHVLAEARGRSREAEQRGDFRAARKALLDFLGAHGDSELAGDARLALKGLDASIRRETALLYERAEMAQERGDYRLANELLLDVIRKDALDELRNRAVPDLRRNQARVKSVYDESMEAVDPLFTSLNFTQARTVLSRAMTQLGGTDYEELMNGAIDAADAGREMIDRLTGLLEKSPTRPVLSFGDRGVGRARPVLARLITDGIVVAQGPAESIIRWNDLTEEQMLEVVRLSGISSPRDLLAIGTVMLHRGRHVRAIDIAKQAMAYQRTEAQARVLLKRVDVAMNAKIYDFADFDQTSDWDLEGKWIVSDSMLVHDGTGMGTATLAVSDYDARGLMLSFSVKFMQAEGALEARVGEADKTFWVSIGSAGIECRYSDGGGVSQAKKEWALTPNENCYVDCRFADGKAVITIDGKPVIEVDAAHPELVSGKLTFQVQGMRLALNEVSIRQAR